MASCKLGEIFGVESVQEEKKGDNGGEDSEDGDSDEEDEEQERAAAFNKHKNNSVRVGGEGTSSASQRSVRRYDEYGNFISRSERARAEKAEKKERDHQLSGSINEVTHRVQFKQPDEEMVQIKEVERMSDDDIERCFMTMANWEAIDTDIGIDYVTRWRICIMTCTTHISGMRFFTFYGPWLRADITDMRWKNHVEGKIKFDEDNNTIRGLEDIIFNLNKGRLIRKHQRTVMEEVVRQKTDKDYLNWTKLGSVSETSSEVHKDQALRVGKQDEEERDRVWNPKPKEPEKTTAPKSPKKDKRKSSIFGIFKKK